MGSARAGSRRPRRRPGDGRLSFVLIRGSPRVFYPAAKHTCVVVTFEVEGATDYGVQVYL